jgi:hypothetical protein
MKRSLSVVIMLSLVALLGIAILSCQTNVAQDESNLRKFKDRLRPGQMREFALQLHETPARTAREARTSERSTPPDWCSRIVPGPGGLGSIPVDLSAAHNLVREFSVASAYGESDTALTGALADAVALTPSGLNEALDAYVSSMSDACALDAVSTELGPASVQMVGHVAVIRPGTGSVAIPPRAQVAVIDLRHLPAVAGLREALEQAVAPALSKPVDRPSRWVRFHNGPVDEVYYPYNYYSVSISTQDQEPLPASGRRDIPLILLTGHRMAPEAAQFAGALRMARRALIIGENVLSEIAEADWRGVGAYGLAVRTKVLDRLFWLPDPLVLHNLFVGQDSIYTQDIQVSEPYIHLIDIAVNSRPGADIDLYVMYDANGDGVFDFPSELIAYSAGSTANERVKLAAPLTPGHYQVWVYGYNVGPGGNTRFDMTVRQLAGQVWPDVIKADVPFRGTTLDYIGAAAWALGKKTIPPVTGPVNRAFIEPVNPFGSVQPPTTARPEMRAALLTAHGMLRRFFPYFDVVGDGIDARLQETLEAVETWNGSDRQGAIDILRRFGEVLQDGHQWVINYGPTPVIGYLPVLLEEINGRPVVRRSADPGVHPGDAIVSINGRPIEEMYAEQYEMTSAATYGYKFYKVCGSVSELTGDAELVLEDPNGLRRSVTVSPLSYDEYFALYDPGESTRPNGPMNDLGFNDLYYINMDRNASPSSSDVSAAIADAVSRNARGLVLDMRGSPGAGQGESAMRLIPYPFYSPQYYTLELAGPDDTVLPMEQYQMLPLDNPAWIGPLVLLTGPSAVSSAENFMQFLVGARRPLSIVGRNSAGTNGNITGVQLPGGFGFTYTGMKVLNPDGTRFHGIGIVPDVEVQLTASALRDGVDEVLLAAIAVLNGL